MTADPATWQAAALKLMPWQRNIPLDLSVIQDILQQHAGNVRNISAAQYQLRTHEHHHALTDRVLLCHLSPDAAYIACLHERPQEPDEGVSYGVSVSDLQSHQQTDIPAVPVEVTGICHSIAWQMDSIRLNVVFQIESDLRIPSLMGAPKVSFPHLSCKCVIQDG